MKKCFQLLVFAALVLGSVVGIAQSIDFGVVQSNLTNTGIIARPPRLFTDVMLAAQADWRRPDLAARHVQTVTRTFQHQNWQPIGGGRSAEGYGRQVCETLTYDPQGRLLHYQFLLLPLAGYPSGELRNEFSYDAHGRVAAIRVASSGLLDSVEDNLTSDVYNRLLTNTPRPIREVTWRALGHPTVQKISLRELLFRYDVAGQLLPPVASLKLISDVNFDGQLHTWTDTVQLAPQVGWRLVAASRSPSCTDTSLLHPSVAWVLPTASLPPAPATGGAALRIQQFVKGDWDYPQGAVAAKRFGDTQYSLTSFFDGAGRLLLARSPLNQHVWRYTYDQQGQLVGLATHQARLTGASRAEKYLVYDGADFVFADCAGQLSQWLPLPNGQRFVLERSRVERVSYQLGADGLPRLAQVATTVAGYRRPVVATLVPVTYQRCHNCPYVRGRNSQRIIAVNHRSSRYAQQGCAPMVATSGITHVVSFAYTFYQPNK